MEKEEEDDDGRRLEEL